VSWSTHISPIRVYGLVIREPVTMAHVQLLAECESPVLSGGACSIGDIATAAFVCAWPAEVSRRKLTSIWTPLAFKIWARFWKPGDDAERFIAWLTAQCDLPPRWTREGSGTELASPWWINRLAQALDAGLTYSEAMTMPLRTLTLVVSAKLEASGVVEFETPRQTEWLKFVQAKRN